MMSKWKAFNEDHKRCIRLVNSNDGNAPDAKPDKLMTQKLFSFFEKKISFFQYLLTKSIAQLIALLNSRLPSLSALHSSSPTYFLFPYPFLFLFSKLYFLSLLSFIPPASRYIPVIIFFFNSFIPHSPFHLNVLIFQLFFMSSNSISDKTEFLEWMKIIIEIVTKRWSLLIWYISRNFLASIN